MMNDEDLDNQIRAVLAVEPSAEQLARLQRFWLERSQAEYRRQRVWRGAALAAAVVAVAAVSVWQFRLAPPQRVQVTDDAMPSDPIARQPVVPRRTDATVPRNLPETEEFVAAGRPPTTYERLIFSIRRRDSVAASSPALTATLDNLIDQLVRDPGADAKQRLASSNLPAGDAERILLRRLTRSTDEKKHAALRLLAQCGSPRSMPALLRLGRRAEFRDAAVATIEQIVGIEGLRGVVDETSHTGLQMALIRRLLVANSEAALGSYLSLVETSDTRAVALAVADEHQDPPVDKLLTFLDHEEESVRISAAVVLGHINGPDVAKSLVERVTQNPEADVEAWIAILACRGPVAEEFLAYATRQPQLLAHVNSARVRWARIVN
jgi:HEAT repeat protein